MIRRLLFLLRWIVLAAPISFVIGSACALFLVLLDRATLARVAHPWLLFLLPVAGVGIVLIYRHVGGSAARGTDLILDEIHEPTTAGVPARIAPLVLGATVITHLFGGSAGREGTAVQMGGGLAATFGRWARLPLADVRTLLMVGVAAGFGGVFGTPMAGAVFAMEVLTLRQFSHAAIVPCLIGGLVGDWGCRAWGVHHTAYRVNVGALAFDWPTALKVAVASLAFGLASAAFVALAHALSSFWKRAIARDWLRPVAGAAIVIGVTFALGTRDYLGLGVTSHSGDGISIVDAFDAGGGVTAMSWAWKLLLTAVTLSSGFKGGEVTPLFFIGATLGHALAMPLGLPTDLAAAAGFVAVFAGATKAPLACAIMAVELFGAGHAAYYLLACVLAYHVSGDAGIYAGQRRGE